MATCSSILAQIIPWTGEPVVHGVAEHQTQLSSCHFHSSLLNIYSARMLKLKLQCFGHLMRRVDSLEKTLMLGGIGAGGEGDDRG